jgi:hypothetical protein
MVTTPAFFWMLKLAMATFRSRKIPSLLLKNFNDLLYFHGEDDRWFSKAEGQCPLQQLQELIMLLLHSGLAAPKRLDKSKMSLNKLVPLSARELE